MLKLVSWSLSNSRITQDWIVREVATGRFILINRHSGLAACGSGQNTSLVQVKPDFTDLSQLWEIVPVHPDVFAGQYPFRLCHREYNGSAAGGNKLIESKASPRELRSQQWYLEMTEETVQPEIDPDLPAFTADAGYYYSLISLSYPDRVASIDRSASHIGAAVILENPIEDYYAAAMEYSAHLRWWFPFLQSLCPLRDAVTWCQYSGGRGAYQRRGSYAIVDSTAGGRRYICVANSATGGYASVENGKVIERDALFLQVRNLHWKLEKSVLDVTGMSSTHTQKEVRCLLTDRRQLQFKLPAAETNVCVNIYSLSGVLLYSEVLPEASGHRVDVSALPSGVYLAEIVLSGHVCHLKILLP